MEHIEILKRLDACNEALEWAKNYESLEHAWNECKRADWMLWLDDKMDLFNDKKRKLIACRFVRETPIGDGKTVWDLLKDERSTNGVIVAEKYANGETNEEKLSSARAAAWAARAAARAAAEDAAGDAWAAARAAAWAAAGDAAGAAAWAARAAAWDVQTDIIRSFGSPFSENNIKGE